MVRELVILEMPERLWRTVAEWRVTWGPVHIQTGGTHERVENGSEPQKGVGTEQERVINNINYRHLILRLDDLLSEVQGWIEFKCTKDELVEATSLVNEAFEANPLVNGRVKELEAKCAKFQKKGVSWKDSCRQAKKSETNLRDNVRDLE
ncbi:unnamed protein product [Sphenostylis stenocarpa]|uniref:Uncharacterized protein n=1 Tax=Sphenostylis stenocarpa TaxID=92480 RepID=A0AA86S8L4_9FABA|nr:unnamed protein product [Sphenostylis stenocarpa]